MKRRVESWVLLPGEKFSTSDSDHVLAVMAAARRLQRTLAYVEGARTPIRYSIRREYAYARHLVGRCTVTYPDPKDTP